MGSSNGSCFISTIAGSRSAAARASHAIAESASPSPACTVAIVTGDTFSRFARASVRGVASFGMGGLGHLGIQIAKAMGAEVVAITSAGKEEWARDLGADHVITRNADVSHQLLDLGGADVILSTTVEPSDISTVMKGLRVRGSLVLTGMTADPLSIMPAGFAFAQQRIIGSIIGTRRDQAELLDLAVRNDIRPVTEVYPLEKANELHERLRQQKVRLRAVMKPTSARYGPGLREEAASARLSATQDQPRVTRKTRTSFLSL